MTEAAIERFKTTGRNDPCPCGSGKKYKKCHLSEDQETEQATALKVQEEARGNANQDGNDDSEQQVRVRQHKAAGGRETHKPGGAKGGNQVKLPRKASR